LRHIFLFRGVVFTEAFLKTVGSSNVFYMQWHFRIGFSTGLAESQTVCGLELVEKACMPC
jgi:hypothetical protein